MTSAVKEHRSPAFAMEQSGRKPPQMTAKAGAAEAIRVLAIRLHPLHPAARDIEGSTRLLHELGDGYGDALDHHRQVVRAACAATTVSRSIRRVTHSSWRSRRLPRWPRPRGSLRSGPSGRSE
jgi:hypothetical protein